MTWLAWLVCAAAFCAYAYALHVGPSCADNLGPWCAGAFFASFAWLAYQYDRKGHR